MKQQSIYWTFLSPKIKKSIKKHYGKEKAKESIKRGKKEYKELVKNAPDLGKGNIMASNAYFAYVFVGAYLGSNKQIPPEEMAKIMCNVLYDMRFYFKLTNLNKDPKKWHRTMKKYQKWYDKGNGEKYPTTWKVHFDEKLHKDGDYYYFSMCPICSYLYSIGLSEIMKPLCETDKVMFMYQHGILYRNNTIASGSDICDYWIVGDKIKNPQ